MQKNLWICLILLKNRWLKYRFFVLFRRVFRDIALDLVWFMGAFIEPDFLAKSERFAGKVRQV